MQIRIKVGNRAEDVGWNITKIFGLVMILGALISTSSRGLVRGPAGSGPKTVMPAAIRSARVDTLTVSFPAKLKKLLVSPGAAVKAGQLVAVLESDELSRQVESARRRVAVAEVRAGVRQRAGMSTALMGMQKRAAARTLELARRRVGEYSLSDNEAAYAAARTRREKIAALVKQHMATAAEVENAQRDEQNELRNLASAREHQSRLQQELETAELESALLESSEAPVDGMDRAAAQIELADARAALNAALGQTAELQVASPNDGVVLSSTLAIGDRVFAGSPILYVADVSRLSFEAAVSATLARQIRPGDAVRLRVPTEPLRYVDARVSSVALAPDPVQQNYVVRAVIGNPDRNAILVGMEGAIEFPHQESAWRRPF
jgi:HlyD family secretion protein